ISINFLIKKAIDQRYSDIQHISVKSEAFLDKQYEETDSISLFNVSNAGLERMKSEIPIDTLDQEADE
ncbi:hypothetical protein PENTCL1PPCAC_26, partial [Pristionchus entomophagus]